MGYKILNSDKNFFWDVLDTACHIAWQKYSIIAYIRHSGIPKLPI